METFQHFATIVAPFFSIAVPSAATAAVFGVVPRIGPGRAFWLAISSRLFLRANPVSQRTEAGNLRHRLLTAHKDQYFIVAGPKGVGKTCIVETATQATFGVVTVRVPAGTSEKEIKSDVFTAITRCHIRMMDNSGSARRVLWWHRFIFRVPATVILQAAERGIAEPFAALDSAARSLTQDFGLRVIIDASSNSLPESANATLRQVSIEVAPMERPILEQLPDLLSLHEALKTANLAEVVWTCVGGVPANYRSLEEIWEGGGCKNLELVVVQFVQDLLDKANKIRVEQVTASERLQELYTLFRESSEVPFFVLENMKLVRPSPDKVLRVVKMRISAGSRGGGRRVLIPADAATALVLRYGITDSPSLKELMALALPVKELE